jgi:transposase
VEARPNARDRRCLSVNRGHHRMGTLIAPHLTSMPKDAGQREHALRDVFNGLRYVIKTGAPWRWTPNNLPSWVAVYQHAQRWLAAGCLEALNADLPQRPSCRRWPQSSVSAASLRRPRQCIEPWTAARCAPRRKRGAGGYDEAKRKKVPKLHLAAHWRLQSTLSGRGDHLVASGAVRV